MCLLENRGFESKKRKKEKLIRLDDLIPKENVLGGGRFLFGVTDINQTTSKQKKNYYGDKQEEKTSKGS